MSPYSIGQFFGAFLFIYVFSRLFLWIARKILKTGLLQTRHLILCHTISLTAATLLGGWGFADGGSPKFLQAFYTYLVPELLWFAIDIFQKKKKAISHDTNTSISVEPPQTPKDVSSEKKRSFLSQLVWQPQSYIEEAVSRYDRTPLYVSDRAYIVYFLALAMVLTVGIASIDTSVIDFDAVFWGIILYGPLCIFVFFRQIWAMALIVMLYGADKIVLMMPPVKAHPMPQIIFFLICFQLSSTAIRIELMRRRQSKAAKLAASPTT